MATKLQGNYEGRFESKSGERVELLMYLFHILNVRYVTGMGNPSKIFHITKYLYSVGIGGFRSPPGRRLYIEKQEEVLSVEI